MRSKATNLGSVDIGSVVSLSCSGAGGGAETSGLRPVDLSPGTAYPLMYARDCALLWTGACGGWGKREKMLDLLAVGERSCGVFRAAARGNEGAGVSTRATTDRIERDPVAHDCRDPHRAASPAPDSHWQFRHQIPRDAKTDNNPRGETRARVVRGDLPLGPRRSSPEAWGSQHRRRRAP